MVAMSLVYLDHNATAPLLPEVADALDRAQREGWANPASQHAAGRRARRFVEDARERIGEILGVKMTSHRPDRVLFTSGGTEANNLALFGFAANAEREARNAELHTSIPHSEFRTPHSALISAVEHPSVRGPAARLAERDWQIDTIPVDRDGRIDVAAFAAQLQPDVRFVSAMLGNNETGVLQPIAEMARLCREQRIVMHTDATQCVGKVPVDFTALGVDALTATAHKFHGPLGIGLLIVRREITLEPLLVGGFQQEGLRPGTETPALVAGLLAALEAYVREGVERTQRLAALRDDLEARLTAAIPDLVIHGRGVPRLPQTTNGAFVGVDRQALFLALDRAEVACSTGSACASGSSEPSPTLTAMGLPTSEIQSSLRFSVGATTTAAEIASAAERIVREYRDLRRLGEGRKIPVSRRSPDPFAI
jgi:cysteine desulfurase